MRFRPILLALALLLFAGCGGGNSSSDSNSVPDGSQQSAQQPGVKGASNVLELSAQKEGGNYRVNVNARGATDLYQLAGSLSFDSGRYRVVNVEAGGGLGGPEDAFFLGRESSPGRVDFAYTKRAHGAGVKGDAWLISVIVEPQSGALKLSDFSLDQTPGKLVVRDSKKHALPVQVQRGGVK